MKSILNTYRTLIMSEHEILNNFLELLKDKFDKNITEEDAIDLLIQYIITKPMFDNLFKDYQFVKQSSISQIIQPVLDNIQVPHLEEFESIQKYFKIKIIKNDIEKQKYILEFYNKFFKDAFPRKTQKFGIIYTPIEVVDFIIHSVNDILINEFNCTLGSTGVYITDPFTGTGTFITRLLQSGLIKSEELYHKYTKEIYANEILLLTYYIATLNIEQVYYNISGVYTPFNGIRLIDTFQSYEDNSHKKNSDIQVIIGNPPYLRNNTGVSYSKLDDRIKNTYVVQTNATLKSALYDSYIRAIRWGSDRIGDNGVMGFVTNAGWLDGNAMDGMRKSLAEEFSSIYVFHLRGNQRTSGERSRQEGGKIFGSGSRAPISITIFVKNPKSVERGKIYFHDIGDYLSREEKLVKIQDYKSINGISAKIGWKSITPDKHHDWFNQRDESFDTFIEVGNKKDKKANAIFANYSNGIVTARDAWCYNSSKSLVMHNIRNTISFYNKEVRRYAKQSANKTINASTFFNKDPKKIKWASSLLTKAKNGVKGVFDKSSFNVSVYRPFEKTWFYFDSLLNQRVAQMPQIFPDNTVKNRVIVVSGVGASKGFSSLMVDALPNFHTLDTCQCFPLKLYKNNRSDKNRNLFSEEYADRIQMTDGITDSGLKHFQDIYLKENISKEDLFYYIYGLLHSEDYRSRYKANLAKQLPRIPAVKKVSDFWAFSKAGRELAELHIHYETAEPYPVNINDGDLFLDDLTSEQYRVVKMKFSGTGKNKDKSIIIYNSHITLSHIPLEAYDYVVNGKSAIEWVMDRQSVKTEKKSGIVNDANAYAIETMNDPAYSLKLLQRIITVSLETMKIVYGLPKFDY